jgi:hypothetical protein
LLRETHLIRDNRTVHAERTADRLETHPFSILKISQMLAGDHDLISSIGEITEICIRPSCVQPLLFDE